MPDLSSSINFRVTFDLTGSMPKMVLADTGTYPVGVNTDLAGVFTITQPDTSVYTGSFSSPDVEWDGSALTEKEHILALASDGSVQIGAYVVSYSVSHPDYTVTTLQRSFYFDYQAPELSLTENFDVFTPELSYSDDTIYTQGSWTITSTTRSWSADFSAGTKTATTQSIDLGLGGFYYDSEYDIDFSSELTYQHNTYTYLYVNDLFEETINTSANTPPVASVLYDYLADLKDTLDSYINNDRLYNDYKRRYEYASSLLQTILKSGCAGDVERIKPYLDEFIRYTNNFQTPAYANTGLPIGAYDFDCGTGGVGGSITKIAATMSGSESSTYTNASFSGKTLLFVVREGLVANDGDHVLSGITITKQNAGDLFIPGEKYIFILTL